MDRRRAAGKINPELPHLKALPESAPRTKSGRIVWAWPEIQASLASGRKMGVPTSVATASASVTAPGSDAGSVQPGSPLRRSPTVNVRDPLANIREAEQKQVVFDYR